MSGKPKSPAPPPAAPRWLAAVAATPARDRAVVVLVAAFTISGVAVALTVDGHRVGTLGLVLTASAVYGAEMKFVGLGGPVWLMARLSRASLRWLLRNELLLQNAIDKAQPNAVPELQKRL